MEATFCLAVQMVYDMTVPWEVKIVLSVIPKRLFANIIAQNAE